MSLEQFRARLAGIDKIIFKEHFYERSIDRLITECVAANALKESSELVKAEEQPAKHADEQKFRVKIRLSAKYFLNLVVVFSGKNLYIITCWRSLR